jgi:hypothetical protein
MLSLTVVASAAAQVQTYNYDGRPQLASGTSVAVVGVDSETPGVARSVALWRAGPRSVAATGFAAEDGGAGAARSTNFIVHPNGEIVPVPEGAVGPSPVDTGKGFQFTGGSGGHGLDPRVTDVRIMDPVTTGKYTYPDGYVSYGNGGQTVNPWTGRTISNADPWAHWPWSPW